nr:hypothetical protein [Desulfobacula sp.]
MGDFMALFHDNKFLVLNTVIFLYTVIVSHASVINFYRTPGVFARYLLFSAHAGFGGAVRQVCNR